MRRFQGPYQMPKGGSGRVPPTRGGTITPAGVNPPPGGWGRGRMAPIPSRWARAGARWVGAIGRATGPYGALGFAVAYGLYERYGLGWFAIDSGPGQYDFTGFTTDCDVPPTNAFANGFVNEKYVWSTNQFFTFCDFTDSNVSAIGGAVHPGADLPASRQVIRTWYTDFSDPPPSKGGWNTGIWRTPAPAKPVPFVPGRITVPIPQEFPTEVPYPQTMTPPRTAPRPGTIVFPDPGGGLGTEPWPGTVTQPGTPTKPYEQPPVKPGVEITPSGPPKRPTDPITNLPPPPNEREHKQRTPLGRAANAVGNVYGKITEVKDVADCLEKAMRDSKGRSPCRGLPLHEKLACLALHGNKIDLAAAAQCIAENEIKDQIIGRISSATSRRLRRNAGTPERPYPLGPGTGGFSTRMR